MSDCFVCGEPARKPAGEPGDGLRVAPVCDLCGAFVTDDARAAAALQGLAEARGMIAVARLRDTEKLLAHYKRLAASYGRQAAELRARLMAIRAALAGLGPVAVDVGVPDQAAAARPGLIDGWEAVAQRFPDGSMPEGAEPVRAEARLSNGLSALLALAGERVTSQDTRAVRCIRRAIISSYRIKPQDKPRISDLFRWPSLDETGPIMTFDAWIYAVTLGVKDDALLEIYNFGPASLAALKELALAYVGFMPEPKEATTR